MNENIIITIDGPAGAGKSTLSKSLAAMLGFAYLDTGAMYRVVGLLVSMRAEPDNESVLNDVLLSLKISFLNDAKYGQRVIANTKDVTDLIRTEEIGHWASRVSRLAPVRKRLTALQQEIGKAGNIVCEGRDMGSVVFPMAKYKFFITASLEQRAKRRFIELSANGRDDVEYSDVFSSIKKRDEEDSSRLLSPLKIPPDAVIIDSSDMDAAGVLNHVMSFLKPVDNPLIFNNDKLAKSH